LPTGRNGREPQAIAKRGPIERLLRYGERDQLDSEDLEVQLCDALRERYRTPSAWEEWWRDRFEGARVELLETAD
jgi:hypothetical protein